MVKPEGSQQCIFDLTGGGQWKLERERHQRGLTPQPPKKNIIYIILLFDISDKPHRFTKQQKNKK